MNLKDLLLPLVAESRMRFADSSLMLFLESVQINNQRTNSNFRPATSKIDFGLKNLELLQLYFRHNKIIGYSGEICYWQTEPCRNLHIIALNMEYNGDLEMPSLKVLKKAALWRGKKAGKVDAERFTMFRLEFVDDDDGYTASDDEFLTTLEKLLAAHFDAHHPMPIEMIEQVALPVAVSRQLWIMIETKPDRDIINMQLYDFEGCICGYIAGIIFRDQFSAFPKNSLERAVKSAVGNASTMISMTLSTNGFDSNETSTTKKKQNVNLTEVGIPNTPIIGMKRKNEICLIAENVTEVSMTKSLLNGKICKMVEKIMGIPCDDQTITFSSLGFDSLKLARLEFALQAEFFGIFSIPYGSVRRNSSIDALSDCILKNSNRENIVSQVNQKSIHLHTLDKKLKEIMKKNGELPLSAAQKRLIFLWELNEHNSSSFIEYLTLKMNNLQIKNFRRAFNRLVARHTALRTIYSKTSQTILSLTEAYFWVRLQIDTELDVPSLIRLFDHTVPMRILVVPQKMNQYRENYNTYKHNNPGTVRFVLKNKSKKSTDSQDTKNGTDEAENSVKSVVIVQQHHIMTDGFSIKLLASELHTLYSQRKPMKPARYQYAHYVLLENRIREDSEEWKHREIFWKNQMSRAELQIAPADKTGQITEHYSGGHLQIKLDHRTQKYLQNIAASCSVTNFTVLLGAFQLLHYKKYGIKDVCTGITVAQRDSPELCTVVGCLLNVIPIISKINSEEEIRDHIIKTSKCLDESVQNQLSFDDLMITLKGSRVTPNSPLFQVLLIMDDFEIISDDNFSPFKNDERGDNDENGGADEIDNAKILDEFGCKDTNFAQYAQVWYFQHREKEITIKIDYNANLFYKSLLEATVQQYLRLIHKIHKNIHTSVGSLKLISCEEESRSYQQRLSNRCDFPQKCTILNVIEKQNQISPSCNKLIQQDISFSNIFLKRKSNRLSRYLTQSCLQFSGENFLFDNFVLLIFDRSVDLFLTVFALWKCGFGVAPVSSDIPESRLHEIVKNLDCPVIIYGCTDNRHNYGELPCKKGPENHSKETFKILSLNPEVQMTTKQNRRYGCTVQFDIHEMNGLLCEYSDENLRKKATEYDLAYMTFTSGSTGVPKGICTEFYGLNNLAANYAELLSIKRSSIVYQVVNQSFDIFFADIIEAQTNGASLHLANQRIPDLEEMSRVTHAYIMPAYLSAIEQKQWDKLMHLEKIHFGGDQIQHRTLKNAIQAGLHFYQQYGLTEHTIYSTCKLMKIGEKASSVGKSLKNIYFFIRDNDGNICERHRVGICCTSGPGISRGYFKNEHLNRQSFFKNSDLTKVELLTFHEKRNFWTGDLATIRNTIGDLQFYGRNDFQIKIRGVRIDIAEIEATLGQCELVKACVLRPQGTEAEQILTAYIIPSKKIQWNEGKTAIKRKLSNYLATKLPLTMIPSQYVFLNEFPLNSNGKVDRKRLSAPEKVITEPNIPAQTEYFLEPWEKRVLEIFMELLPGKVIKPEDSFFEVGGDSLKALLAVQNIHDELGINLQLKDIFQLTSFRAILDHLKFSYRTTGSKDFRKKLETDSLTSDTNEILHKSTLSTKDSRTINNNIPKEKYEEEMDEKGANSAAAHQDHCYCSGFKYGPPGVSNLQPNIEYSKFCCSGPSASRFSSLSMGKKEVDVMPCEILSDNELKSKFWLDKKGIPLSLSQERLLFLYSFGKEHRESYMLQFLIKFFGAVNLKDLGAALNFVMRKHRVLRTIIWRRANKNIQEVLSLSECYMKIGESRPQHNQVILKSGIGAYLPELFGNPLLTIVSSTVSSSLQLLLTFDHLVVDGRSIAVLANDLVEIYKNLISNKQNSSVKYFHTVDDVNNSYAFFCIKQRFQLQKFNNESNIVAAAATMLKGQEAEKWRVLEEVVEKLQKSPPLNIPGDSAADEGSDLRCKLMKFKIPASLAAIRAFCAQRRCTLLAYLLCIFSLTIRLKQQLKEFAVVSTVLNRTPDTMNCVGLFVNAVVIAVGTNFQEISHIIRDVQGQIANALHFQHIPFEYFIQKLNPKRNNVGRAAYPISFVVQNASATKLPKIEGVETVVEEIPSKYAKFDQSWYFTEFEDNIEMTVEYRVAKYSNSTIRSSVKLFNQIAYEALSKNEVSSILRICDSFGVDEAIQNFEQNENEIEAIEIRSRTTKKPLETELLKIWKETLSDPEISVFDNFFAKGGHSLLIGNVCYKIEKRLGYKCPPQTIFKYQTIKELAEHLNSPIKTTVKEEKCRLEVCPLQEPLVKLYFNSIAESATTETATTTFDTIKAFQTGFTISLKSLDFPKLRRALNIVISSHSALRTTFYQQDNKFFQEIHSKTEIYIASQITARSPVSDLGNPFHTVPFLCWVTYDTRQLTDAPSYNLNFRISHVICDGKSLAILAGELQNAYFQNRRISKKNLDYTQFTRQVEQRFREKSNELTAYWRKALAHTESMKLYPDKIAISQTSRCKTVSQMFKNLNEVVKKLAQKCNCSTFAVQLAAFCIILSSKVPSISKLLISCPLDMRPPENEDCVGMCVNSMPLVVNLEKTSPRDLIREAAQSLTNAYLNADISSDIIEKLCESSHFHRVMIVSNSVAALSSGQYVLLNDDVPNTKCDLTLFVTQQENDIAAKIEYKKDLFYNETITNMLNCWGKVIRKMKFNIDEEDRKKKQLEKKEERLFWSFPKKNNENVSPSCDFPRFNFSRLLREAFINSFEGAKVSIIGNKEIINNSTLRKRIYCTSRTLQEKVTQITGETLRPDTIVPIVALKSTKTLIACLATIMAGAAYLPIDSTDPVKRIKNILEQVQAKFYVTVKDVTNSDAKMNEITAFIQDALEIQVNCIGNSDENSYKTVKHLETTSVDLAYVIFTSGTTGIPKGVAICQRGLLNMATACTQNFWMKPTDIVYQFTNFTFDNSILEVIMALVNRCTLFVKEDFFTKHAFFDEIQRAHITHVLLFPGLVETFTDKEIQELRHLRYWIVGAESVSERILNCALKAGVNVIQNYGPTETTAYALTKRMKLLDRPNNIGQGIANVTIEVRNVTGQETVPKMGIGELHINGVGVMRGYIFDPKIPDSEKSLIQNKKNDNIGRCGTSKKAGFSKLPTGSSYATRDVVRIQPNNDVVFLGRCDQQVKLRGYRIELGEIEVTLCQHPLIHSAKVILKQTGQQQQLAAYVILTGMEKELDRNALRLFLLERLPHYMVPTQYFCLQQFPLTKNSKIDVQALKNIRKAANDNSMKQVKLSNSIEQKLLQFFQGILQTDMLSVDDDFFVQGGNSFTATRLAELVATNITPHFDASYIFRHRTPKKLAESILSIQQTQQTGSTNWFENTEIHQIQKKNLHANDIPLSYQQQQSRFLNETPQRQYYELVFVQKFDSSTSLRHLFFAFQRLVLRHSSFRTIFPENRYEARQEILSGTEVYFYSDLLQQGNFPNDNGAEEKINVLREERVNFRKEPPILCVIQKTNNGYYRAILRINHIISDAWSTKLLETDLSQLYQQILHNKGFTDTKLKFTYAEYSIEQTKQQQFLKIIGAEYAGKIATWVVNNQNFNKIVESWEDGEKQVFQDMRSRLSTAQTHGSVGKKQYLKFLTSRNYWKAEFSIDKVQIEKMCTYFESTPFVIFLGAFTLSLHELSATEQLIVSVPFANRNSKTCNIIGNFLNYLLICSAYSVSTATAINTATAAAATPITATSNPSATKNATKEAIMDDNKDISCRSGSPLTSMKEYIQKLNEAVDEARQFEQIPFILLLQLIKNELKKCGIWKMEIMNRLHKAIFFNFRYELESNNDWVIGEAETQAPTGCVHYIEVDVDYTHNQYWCRLRMKKLGNNLNFIQDLHERMIFYLQQMCPAQVSAVGDLETDSVGDVTLKLRNIWSECIGKKRIRNDDDFFVEGGNSLLTLKLRRRIEEEMKIDIEIDEIFEYSTFSEMNEFLQKRLMDIRSAFSGSCHSKISKIDGKETTNRKNDDPEDQLPSPTDAPQYQLRNDIAEETRNMQNFENIKTVQLLHGNTSDYTVDTVIVFFHALVGGVKWTYAPLIRQLVEKLPAHFHIIGVQHPDSFSQRSSNYKYYCSIESLCTKYADDLYDHLWPAKLRIFIGASFGAILAYQCAIQLQRRGDFLMLILRKFQPFPHPFRVT